MDTLPIGRTDITVTRIVLGCGNFGGVGSSPAFFGQGTPKETAFALMDRAWELGITTFDTADAYGGGRSETWIGEWRTGKALDVHEQLRIQTKTFNPMDTGQDGGLAAHRIRRQIDMSLARLGVERVDVYMAHDFDPAVPQEETLLALDEIRRAGKIGVAGASNFTADQLAEALEISELERIGRYEVVQNAFSLLEQADRETVFPVCREHGISYEPFSPLAGGWLSGKYRREVAPPEGSRMTQRPEPYERFRVEPVWNALDALRDQAILHGVSMSALSLAWLLHLSEVSAVVVGPNRVEHLADVEQALAIQLTPAEQAKISEVFAWVS
jgi:aryl-alcohol dehydrogenase-like predicted oxidoreductase